MSITLNFQGEISADKTYVLTTDLDVAGADEIGDLLFAIRQATGADFIVLAPGTSLAELRDYVEKAGLVVVDRERLCKEFEFRITQALGRGISSIPGLPERRDYVPREVNLAMAAVSTWLD